MEQVYRRVFNADYFEIDEHTWRIISVLSDDEHEIQAELLVGVPEMIIRDAKITFTRFPLEQCLPIQEKAACLIGTNITVDYRKRVFELFMGPQGCPNLMNVLGVAVPGFAYIYYPHLVKTGRMTSEEWFRIVRSNYAQDCLAHTLLQYPDKQKNPVALK